MVIFGDRPTYLGTWWLQPPTQAPLPPMRHDAMGADFALMHVPKIFLDPDFSLPLSQCRGFPPSFFSAMLHLVRFHLDHEVLQVLLLTRALRQIKTNLDRDLPNGEVMASLVPHSSPAWPCWYCAMYVGCLHRHSVSPFKEQVPSPRFPVSMGAALVGHSIPMVFRDSWTVPVSGSTYHPPSTYPSIHRTRETSPPTYSSTE
jgi:hypothetical protein